VDLASFEDLDGRLARRTVGVVPGFAPKVFMPNALMNGGQPINKTDIVSRGRFLYQQQ
jgi:hypothetical protein